MKTYFSKLNLEGIPNRFVDYSTESAFKLADEQEDFVVAKLREYYGNQYYWFTTREFFKSMKNEENRIKGDIVGIRYGEVIPCCWIDLKVNHYDPIDNIKHPHRVGTITLGSILGFGKDSVNNWYLCTNYNGTEFCCVKGIDIYNKFMKGKCLLECNDPKRKPYKELAKIPDTAYRIKNFEGKNPKDFMPSFIFYDKYQ